MQAITPRKALLVSACIVFLFSGGDWPQFRGPFSSSTALGKVPPTSFTVNENGQGPKIAWRVKLPGRGPSSPIVVGNRIFVTAASGIRHDRMHVLAFDALTGRSLWQREFWATGRTYSHPQSDNSAPTPASDGKRIFAFFSSNDLICLDLEGNLQWVRGLAHDWPKAGNDIGMSSSPVVAGDTVIVQVDNQGDSFAAGILAANGETRWRIARPSAANWSSPTLVRRGASAVDLAIFQSPTKLTAVQAQTGSQVWELNQACDGISSPTPWGDTLLVPSQGITSILASTTAKEPVVKWNSPKLNPGAASPIVYQNKVLVANRGGVVAAGSLETGQVLWQLRLEGPFWATPVVAGDYMFLVNFKGLVQVVNLAGEKGEKAGEGFLNDPIQASPAIADGALYLRSDQYLWKIADPNP